MWRDMSRGMRMDAPPLQTPYLNTGKCYEGMKYIVKQISRRYPCLESHTSPGVKGNLFKISVVLHNFLKQRYMPSEVSDSDNRVK